MHPRLEQHIKQHLGEESDLPENFNALLRDVNRAYDLLDQQRADLMETLEQSARTMLERNATLTRNLESQRKSQQELSQSYEVLNATLNASNEGILVVGNDDTVVAFNDRYVDLIRASREEILSRTGTDLFHYSCTLFSNPSQLYDQLAAIREPGSSAFEEYRFHDGTIIEIYSHHHEIAGFIWMIRDITEVREKEDTISYQAYHDSLTGLPNRVHLQQKLSEAIDESTDTHKRFALCYLDLDGFKTINDSLGHSTGDELLIEVAKRLQDVMRPEDTLARVGGDEFIVLINHVQNHDQVLEAAEHLLLRLCDPIRLGRREFVVGASMGIAIYPTDGEEAGILMRNADIAMYRAKANGKNCYHLFTPSLERIAVQRMSLETSLRKALESNALELYYQPKVCLHDIREGMSTGHLHSFEALLRWPKSNGEFVSPESFIHIAEDAGMIGRIGFWILEQACKQAKAWYQQGYQANISINISPRQFLIPNFHQEIVRTIHEMDIPTSLISIEITESLLMQDLTHARHVLEYFRENGLFIYLDDFGTGFSSLNYLKNLPVDAIKIDRTFVKDLSTSTADQAIAASIISLGKNLDMLIVAEGIENAEQADFLIRNGCDLAQGYYYGHPVSAADAEQFLHPDDLLHCNIAQKPSAE
ncbi:putative bifunctional diguanylate cyclase/phosphodiesterase [Thalassolituus sp.]|uniref:putative bifunctional diguanylate cyclase/phosphodiesterase n=1 Tax=Thalassolituus sp. TaxID=2030822 RepID=UPI0035189DB1